MGNNKHIPYGIIFKRSRCLNSSLLESKNTTNIDKRYNNLKLQIENSVDGSIDPSVKKSVSQFIESICNENANKYYRYPLFLIEKLNTINQDISDNIVENYTSAVLPYVEDLSYIKETVNRYELSDNQKEKILEAARQYNVADRILKNHDRISKRFNIQSEVTKIKSRGLKNVTESCCEMIDTYNIKPYQKLNLCIEELTYLFDKNAIDYDKKDLVSYVAEYFIINNPIMNSSDVNGYRKALSENACLDEEDLEKVQYIYQDENDFDCHGKTSIKKEIDRFLRCSNKDARALEICINNSLDYNYKEDIITNFDKLMYLIWDVQKSGICDQKEYFGINTEGFFDSLVRKIEDNISSIWKTEYCFSKDDILKLINNIEKFNSIIITNVNDSDDYKCMVTKFKSEISKLISKLVELRDLVYTESNLEAIKFVNSNSFNCLPLNEFKIFKFNNLVIAAMNLDKFLKDKSKNIYTKGKEKITKFINKSKKILFNESANIYSYITEDSKLDICVAQYYFDESKLEEVEKFFDEACKEFNYSLNINGNYTSKAYYLINPGILEVHLKESTIIKLEEADWKLVDESEKLDLDVYIDEFATINAVIESYDNFCSLYTLESVQNKISNFSRNNSLDIDHYTVAMEALSLLDVSKEDINVFSEKFSNYRYNTAVLESVLTESEYKRELIQIKEISDNWIKEEYVPINIQWEAYQILCAVLEDAPNIEKPEVKKPKIDIKNKISSIKNKHNTQNSENNSKEEKDVKDSNSNDNDEEFRNNPFKGININSIKLYLEGLKGKMKNMSQKQKEISKNLDNSFRRFVKAMKDTLVSDRREAIIKGSVIPSFSKCVNLSLGLAGIGFLTDPLVPVIIAIGGFAVSKRLTQKERLLLLDEIETELEVVDKEISIAESKNQIKKYRTLLKYKKDLQRQYQRIRYNVRIGKDIMAGSTAGIKDSN